MTVAETLLVFAGAPLAIIAVLALIIYWPRGRKRARYKSGQPWEHEPVWYEPHPEGPAGGHGVGGGYGAGVPGAGTQAIGSSVYGEPTDGGHGRPGQASHGATTAGVSAPPRGTGGPLGGARGTW
ncbi:aa3-type cytochrome oxidase subunit CtaJ [Blastococcus sp. PRF04-17]|uniref:aa3-type cytochrome oxidase subunit CtaJ n=1 Tax=Blastococcus sp. PRF04-17 TaxID=2933797 RepID=UPI001FF30B0F|nr:hypothetical protein [Blastococcus sp. PRF04-17]UOY03390.1 hypothetical protein MVA48_08675 [Blastococcus sp. PRF04-17]